MLTDSSGVDALNVLVLSPTIITWIIFMLLKEKRVNLPLSKDDHLSSVFPRLFAAFRLASFILYLISLVSLHSEVQIWCDYYLSLHS